MTERTYLTEKQFGSFDEGYRRLQQVFVDLEHGHSFNDVSDTFKRAISDIGVLYGTEIPESPEPQRDDPSV